MAEQQQNAAGDYETSRTYIRESRLKVFDYKKTSPREYEVSHMSYLREVTSRGSLQALSLLQFTSARIMRSLSVSEVD
ncbi:hypothetical protein X797_011201 [Metarhizium robertsii]|uniref:Uncharacterized protein n=1 Tax=Metarhizium robertsii TaxID=568076 RepID=A0A014PJ87_9HYPO|nr:hypothetical protein X797_011201 [Metarhizium robertsii]